MTKPFATFVFPFPPKPKERPRVNRKTGTMYTPKPTMDFQRAVAKAALEQLSGDRHVRVDAAFRLDIYVRRDRFVVKVWLVEPVTHACKGDLDNYTKSIMDGLNGVLYSDDSQVVDVRAKFEAA